MTLCHQLVNFTWWQVLAWPNLLGWSNLLLHTSASLGLCHSRLLWANTLLCCLSCDILLSLPLWTLRLNLLLLLAQLVFVDAAVFFLIALPCNVFPRSWSLAAVFPPVFAFFFSEAISIQLLCLLLWLGLPPFLGALNPGHNFNSLEASLFSFSCNIVMWLESTLVPSGYCLRQWLVWHQKGMMLFSLSPSIRLLLHIATICMHGMPSTFGTPQVQVPKWEP